jgi:hypothetical protein
MPLFEVLWLQAPRLGDEYRFDQDFRSFCVINQFQDPTLFPNDQLTSQRYVYVPLPGGGELPLHFYSLGYWLLFYNEESLYVSDLPEPNSQEKLAHILDMIVETGFEVEPVSGSLNPTFGV